MLKRKDTNRVTNTKCKCGKYLLEFEIILGDKCTNCTRLEKAKHNKDQAKITVNTLKFF